jgi:hypothetical protein
MKKKERKLKIFPPPPKQIIFLDGVVRTDSRSGSQEIPRKVQSYGHYRELVE